MDQITWLALGLLALAVSAATLYTDLEDILGGFIGMLLWAYWAFGATNVEIINGVATYTREYTGLAFMGAGAAVVMLIVMLSGAFTVLDPREGDYFPGEKTEPP